MDKLCGSIPAQKPQVLTLTLSGFDPAPSGNGGCLTLYLNGQTACVWNATDQSGKLVTNGFYELVITQPLSDGTSVTLERTVFIDPQGRTAPAQVTAWPNILHGGGQVKITAVIGTSPADSGSRIKIYTVSGELVRTLIPSAGQVTWDLNNSTGQAVSSGLYLVVLDGTDPSTDDPVEQTVKVAVIR